MLTIEEIYEILKYNSDPSQSAVVFGVQNGDEGKGVVTKEVNEEAVELVSSNEVDISILAHDFAQNNPGFSYDQGLFDAVRNTLLGNPIPVEYSGMLLDPFLLTERFAGGANAGHTLHDDDLVMNQVPSGIVNPFTYCLLGTGMFIEPRFLVGTELEKLAKKGIPVTPRNFGISSRAHMTLDYHKAEDQENFDLEVWTATGNGIKQTARDKMDRKGFRFVDWLNPQRMLKILEERVKIPMPDYQAFVDSYNPERAVLGPLIAQEEDLLADPRFRFTLFEGAQGLWLCIDDGQYPGTTSSNPCRPPRRTDVAIGVMKMYTSSVGIGDRPFVAKMSEELEDKFRDPWEEFGARTGKPRNLGWFDAFATKRALKRTRPDKIVGTCLDRLEEVARQGEKLYIVVGYEVDGKEYRIDKPGYAEWHTSFDDGETLSRAKPILEEIEPWTQTRDTEGNLTRLAAAYQKRIEDLLGMKFSMMRVGPGSKDIIKYERLLS